MPNIITHMYFANEVKKHLSEELKAIISENNDAFIFGSVGPDFLFALREIGLEIGRYPNIMQYVHQYEVFTKIAKYLNEKPDRLLISYVLGLMCHYVADLHGHPYVNFFCEEGVVKDLRPIQAKSVHTLIESACDEYVCTERMGYKNSNKYKPHKELKTKKKTRLKVGKMYEDVINQIYGISLPAKKASSALEITRMFLGVANDPSGRLRPIVDKIEDKYAAKKKFTALMRPPEGYGKVDYLNFEHKEWRVARNRSQTSDFDFIELLGTAKETAASLYLPMLYSAIKDGSIMPKEHFRVNYEGIDVAYIEEQAIGLDSPDLPVYVRKELAKETLIEEVQTEETVIEEVALQEAEQKEIAIEEVAVQEVEQKEIAIEEVVVQEVEQKESVVEEVAVQEVEQKESVVEEVQLEDKASKELDK